MLIPSAYQVSMLEHRNEWTETTVSQTWQHFSVRFLLEGEMPPLKVVCCWLFEVKQQFWERPKQEKRHEQQTTRNCPSFKRGMSST
jgi:hypothetical protein